MSEIALFPLKVVVLPGGRLPLRIFEPRYLDMIKRCLSDGTGFGIVLIREGSDFLSSADQQLPAVSHLGTYVRVIDFDQHPSGMLAIMVEGDRKFAVGDQYEQADRLMMGEVTFLDPEPETALPTDKGHLASILESLLLHEEVARLGYDVNLESATQVGSRLTELLPCDIEVRERLFRIKDPLARLDEIDRLIAKLER